MLKRATPLNRSGWGRFQRLGCACPRVTQFTSLSLSELRYTELPREHPKGGLSQFDNIFGSVALGKCTYWQGTNNSVFSCNIYFECEGLIFPLNSLVNIRKMYNFAAQKDEKLRRCLELLLNPV